MRPRILLIVLIIALISFFAWLALRKLPFLEFMATHTPASNPVNPAVVKSWKGPGFLEFLPDPARPAMATYCAPVHIVDSMAGIAAARLPFLHERALTGLHDASQKPLAFGYCHEDSSTIPWKSIQGMLGGEPGRWWVRFRIVDNLANESSRTFVAQGSTLEKLDENLDQATEKIAQEMTKQAEAKRGRPPVWRQNVVDSRDHQSYPVVNVGGSRWLARNLAYHAKSAICPEAQDSICKRKGYLYKFEDALDACPAGWTLPTDAQWRALAQSLPRLDLATLPTREGISYQLRDDSDFAPLLRGIADGKAKPRLAKQAWWWSAQTCKDDSDCGPFRRKYIVHLLDDMTVAWGLHWNPRDSAARDGWSRMLAWQQLGLPVRCVAE